MREPRPRTPHRRALDGVIVMYMTPDELVKPRKQLRMNQAALAEALGVTQGALSRWERGQRRIPEMAARLIKRLSDERTGSK